MVVNVICRISGLVLAVFLLAALPGCPLLQNNSPALSGSGMDMFAPVVMRVHPLSCVVNNGKTTLVQARLELTDQMGDVTKGVGVAQLELFNYEALLPGNKGRQITHWSIPITTPQANREHWNAITRTYLFELPISLAGGYRPNAKYVLTASFVLPNGAQLKSDAVISTK